MSRIKVTQLSAPAEEQRSIASTRSSLSRAGLVAAAAVVAAAPVQFLLTSGPARSQGDRVLLTDWQYAPRSINSRQGPTRERTDHPARLASPAARRQRHNRARGRRQRAGRSATTTLNRTIRTQTQQLSIDYNATACTVHASVPEAKRYILRTTY